MQFSNVKVPKVKILAFLLPIGGCYASHAVLILAAPNAFLIAELGNFLSNGVLAFEEAPRGERRLASIFLAARYRHSVAAFIAFEEVCKTKGSADLTKAFKALTTIALLH